jgi:hypothetical protein
MQPALTPSIDRLGAALRALRQVHPDEDPTSLGAKCLRAVINQLAEEGVSQEDLQPLAALEGALAQVKPQAKPEEGFQGRERRRRSPPSEPFLARVAAVIDLLVKAGSEEGEAAQIVMRWLLAAGVPPPQQGPDARGWKRLLFWRSRLQQGLVSPEAIEEYREFNRQLEEIPPGDRVKRVLDDQLWDRRRKSR